jgi:predicted O-methyltransferase YrrM
VNRVIEEIYGSGVVRDEEGNEYPLHSNVDRQEGEFLYELVRADAGIRRTLEVGFAYGLSSLYICEALADRESRSHTMVDPNQNGAWRGIGMTNLKRAGFDFCTLIEARSEFALPRLAEAEPGQFDLVFIDGFHTFDHTLIDMFYASRMIRVGGYIVVDDCNHTPVAKAVSYFSRYPAYELRNQPWAAGTRKRRLGNLARRVLSPPLAARWLPVALHDRLYLRSIFSGTVALRKVAADTRDWVWYEPF